MDKDKDPKADNNDDQNMDESMKDNKEEEEESMDDQNQDELTKDKEEEEKTMDDQDQDESSNDDRKKDEGQEDEDESANFDQTYKRKCTGLGSFLSAMMEDPSAQQRQQRQPSEARTETEAGSNPYQRKSTGLGSFLAAMKENPQQSQSRPAAEAEAGPRQYYDKDYYDQVCDTGNGVPRSLKSQRPTNNTSLYCQVCQLTCNSQLMYDQHVRGAKHKKKVANSGGGGGGGDDNYNDGDGGYSANEQAPGPKDLREMLRRTEEAVVGADYLEELIPESDMNGMYPPQYKCNLCDMTTSCSNMFTHMIGSKHRATFFSDLYGWRLERADAAIRAKEAEDRDGKKLDQIKITMSDRQYPWPPGKAPWMVEEAAPSTSAATKAPAPATSIQKEPKSSNNDLSDFLQTVYEETERDREKESVANSPISEVLVAISQCTVKNGEDAKLAYELSKSLIKNIVNYKSNRVAVKHAGDLFTCSDSLLKSLHSIMFIPELAMGNAPQHDSHPQSSDGLQRKKKKKTKQLQHQVPQQSSNGQVTSHWQPDPPKRPRQSRNPHQDPHPTDHYSPTSTVPHQRAMPLQQHPNMAPSHPRPDNNFGGDHYPHQPAVPHHRGIPMRQHQNRPPRQVMPDDNFGDDHYPPPSTDTRHRAMPLQQHPNMAAYHPRPDDNFGGDHYPPTPTVPHHRGMPMRQHQNRPPRQVMSDDNFGDDQYSSPPSDVHHKGMPLQQHPNMAPNHPRPDDNFDDHYLPPQNDVHHGDMPLQQHQNTAPHPLRPDDNFGDEHYLPPPNDALNTYSQRKKRGKKGGRNNQAARLLALADLS